ncbi:hypothetical protein ACFSMW_04825 [Virgibacillus halophilus]|uniref:Uncharacterized protein n=1 Tax=Tigheibacillus halophilus TaxID=361280 RepID=A0ABU5CB34_9BACI|nr:hypothetical protein [Virgibacillus halophilus]
MNEVNYIRQTLKMYGFSFCEDDIPYIHSILFTIIQEQPSLDRFPLPYHEFPFLIVDKELLK